MKRQLSLFFRRCWTSLKVGILFWTGETPVFVIEAKHNVCLDSSTEPLLDRCLVKWTPSNRHVSLLHFKVGHCEPLLQYQTQRLLTHRASVTIGMEPVRRGHALVLQPCFQRLCMCWLKEKRAGSIRFGGPLAVAENRKNTRKKTTHALSYEQHEELSLSRTANQYRFPCGVRAAVALQAKPLWAAGVCLPCLPARLCNLFTVSKARAPLLAAHDLHDVLCRTFCLRRGGLFCVSWRHSYARSCRRGHGTGYFLRNLPCKAAIERLF